MVVGPPTASVVDPYVMWSPIISRQPLVWPERARVAVCVVLTLETMDWDESEPNVHRPPLLRNTFPKWAPDITRHSLYEYGNRVGIFRTLDVLDRFGVPRSVALDARLAERAPQLVEVLKRQDTEIIGHGISSNVMITSQMSEDAERSYIEDTIDRLRRATGLHMKGWLGTEYGESERTVRLLYEAGVEYVLDWPIDEQPYLLSGNNWAIVGLPVMVELDDVNTTIVWTGTDVPERRRCLDIVQYQALVIRQFDRLYRDAGETGRLFILNLHPWIIGQPFRIKYFESIIRELSAYSGVWFTNPMAVADWYKGFSSLNAVVT